MTGVQTCALPIWRISYGVGVERTFPLHSPRIDRVEVVRHGSVRRAKLYYLRDRKGKSARVKERRRTKEVIVPETVEAQDDENQD